MDSHQEFPHHGADGLDLLETAVRDEVAVVAPDMGGLWLAALRAGM